MVYTKLYDAKVHLLSFFAWCLPVVDDWFRRWNQCAAKIFSPNWHKVLLVVVPIRKTKQDPDGLFNRW